MNGGSKDLLLFLGRFHPVLVHLPIGGLLLAGLLELVAKFPRFKEAAQCNRLILGVVAVSSATAALLGWLLSHSGDYEPELLRWHQWAGFAVAVSCVATFLVNCLNWPRAYGALLLTTLVLLGTASHFGGSITHGKDFLTRYAPAPLRSLLGGKPQPTATHPVAVKPMDQRVFEDLVQPVLQQRCLACHGPEKQKADLRIDSLEALLKGGKNGPAIVPGNAAESPMIQRLLLPLSHDDHMPPEGKRQPTPAQILLLQWWIQTGISNREELSALPGR